jgi:signal transduction histidine kinase
MSQLISNLLDVSRIQAEKIHLATESVDLGHLVKDVAERFVYVLAQAQSPLRIEQEGPVVGSWDKSRLDQVITNLLSNAAKFGKGAPIVVSTFLRGATAELIVRDHGIGIAPEKVPHIFNRFERAVPTESYAGLGLGLFIVRAIVEAHGGSVRAESTLGAGTSMIVELPLRRPPPK